MPQDYNNISLKYQTVHALKWSFLGEFVSRSLGPIVFLILARLLVPEDFGVFAAATVIISFFQVLSEAGLGKALIQRQENVDECATIVFWLNLGFALVASAVLQVFSPYIAAFFQEDRITSVVRLLSLQLVLAAFSSVQQALIQRDLQFKKLFWVRFLTTGVPGMASIPLAIYGLGYWALIIGTLAGQISQSILFWLLSAWRPKLHLDRSLMRELSGFGKWVTLSGLLTWFYSWLDTIMVGHFLGTHDMGLYRTGNSLVIMLFGLMFPPMMPVLYSSFSRNQHDMEGLKKALVTVARTIALFSIPTGLFLYTSSDLIAAVVFGLNWAGVNKVIAAMGLLNAFSWIVAANGEVYRAIGKPNIEAWATALMLIIYLVGYLLSIQYGLQLFLNVRLALGFVAFLVHIVIARAIIQIPISDWFYKGILFVPIAVSILIGQFDYSLGVPLLDLLLMLLIFSILSLLGYIIFERSFILRLFKFGISKG